MNAKENRQERLRLQKNSLAIRKYKDEDHCLQKTRAVMEIVKSVLRYTQKHQKASNMVYRCINAR